MFICKCFQKKKAENIIRNGSNFSVRFFFRTHNRTICDYKNNRTNTKNS